MPNGVSAMSSIAVNEGRATRIADYTSMGRNAAPRSKKTLRASTAAARRGMKKRIAMAKNGRMTHGGGGISATRQTHGGKANLKQFKKAEAEFQSNFYAGTPYSKARSKTANYKPEAKGSSSRNWRKTKVPKTDAVGRRKK